MGQKRRCREIFSCHDTILESASIDLTHPDLKHLFSITCRFWHVVRIHIRTDDSVYIYICMKCKQRFLLTNLISSCFLEMTMQTMKVLRFPLIGLCIFIDSGSHGMLNKMKKITARNDSCVRWSYWCPYLHRHIKYWIVFSEYIYMSLYCLLCWLFTDRIC